MIRNVLTHVGGIELYGIVSVLLFFAFFLGMLVWAFRLKSTHLESMALLPLRDDPTPLHPTTPPLHPDPRHPRHE